MTLASNLGVEGTKIIGLTMKLIISPKRLLLVNVDTPNKKPTNMKIILHLIKKFSNEFTDIKNNY